MLRTVKLLSKEAGVGSGSGLRVAVTGATGYIGSFVVEELLKRYDGGGATSG